MIQRFTLFVAALLLFCSGDAHAQNLMRNGDFAKGTEGWVLPASAKAQASIVDAQAGANTKALRFAITPVEGEMPWNIILRQPLSAALKKGDALIFKAWMRSPQSLKATVFLEAKDEKYTKSLDKIVTLSPEWKEYDVLGTVKDDYAADATSIGFHLGHGAGTIEIAGLRLQSGAPVVVAAPPVAAPVAAVTLPPFAGVPSLGNPQTIVANGDFASPLPGTWNANGPVAPKMEIVDAEVGTYRRAVRLTTAIKPDDMPWHARLAAARTPVAIAKDSIIAVRFWARSPQSSNIGVNYQMSVDPFPKSITKISKLTPEWKELRIYGITDRAYAANESNFEFHIGFVSGTIEIAGVRVENYGVTPLADVENKVGVQTIDYWGGQKHDDGWKKAALQRIEKHRKGDLKVRVVDARGKAIPNATIKLAQTRQLFRWGSAVVARRLIETEDADDLRYQKEVARLFNTVVFENDLKWENRNERKTELALGALKWLQANKMDVRGHTLVWGARKYMPPVASEKWDDTEALRTLVRTRVREQATAFKGQLYVWDVVNEAATNIELWDKLGWDEFANVYTIAREIDPNVRLAYNDYNITNENKGTWHLELVKKRIQFLIDKKVPFDIIGDQAHISVPLTPIDRVLVRLDEMAKFGKPIEITEFDVQVHDDKIHGDYVRDFLIASFSQPQVESFVMWGFWEKSHWLAKEGGAMIRADWSKRPAQLAYEDLVLKQWMTNTTSKTARDGVLQTRAFLGDYDVVVSANGKTKTMKLKLPKAGARVQIVL